MTRAAFGARMAFAYHADHGDKSYDSVNGGINRMVSGVPTSKLPDH